MSIFSKIFSRSSMSSKSADTLVFGVQIKANSNEFIFIDGDSPNFMPPTRLLEYVPILKQAFSLRLHALTSIPVQTNWPFGDFHEFLYAMEYDRLVYGEAFALRLINRSRQWIDYQILDPTTINIHKYGPKRNDYRYEQISDGKVARRWPRELICHIADLDGFTESVSSLRNAYSAAMTLYTIENVIPSQFGSNGIPLRVMEVHNLLPRDRKEFVAKLKLATSNPHRAFDLLGTEATIKIHDLIPGVDDLGLDKMADTARDNIAHAFGVPPALLRRDIANYATANVYRASFWEDTIIPLARQYERLINEWAGGYSVSVKFEFDQTPVRQAQRADMADALVSYVTAGVPVDIAAEALGLTQIASRVAISTSISEDTADTPGGIANSTSPTTQGNQATRPVIQPAKADLLCWRRKTLNRARKSPIKAVVKFESSAIPEYVKSAVESGLEQIVTLPQAEQLDAIRDVFSAAISTVENDIT